jgi:uroporphyrinogen-III synthase
MMRVAVTRAMPEAKATAERVRALGAEPVLAPLLSIEPRAFDADVSGAQALLFTSINGVKSFVLRSAGPAKINVLAVGDATARAAREMGFPGVRSAGGDGAALVEAAKSMLDPNAGKLIHISGAHVASDVAGALTAAGFEVERRIAYEALQASTLPEAFRQPLDAVLFYSARAAQAFIALGAPRSRDLIAACLSPGVAKAAGQVAWKQIIVAPAPREEALLAVLLQGRNTPAGASA